MIYLQPCNLHFNHTAADTSIFLTGHHYSNNIHLHVAHHVSFVHVIVTSVEKAKTELTKTNVPSFNCWVRPIIKKQDLIRPKLLDCF